MTQLPHNVSKWQLRPMVGFDVELLVVPEELLKSFRRVSKRYPASCISVQARPSPARAGAVSHEAHTAKRQLVTHLLPNVTPFRSTRAREALVPLRDVIHYRPWCVWKRTPFVVVETLPQHRRVGVDNL